MYHRFRAAALTVCLAGCRTFGASNDQDMLPLRVRELTATHQRLAATIAAGRFIEGMADATDPTGFFPGALIADATNGRGPAGTRAFLQRDTLNKTSRAYLTVTRLDVSADGNDGYSYGYLDVVRAGGDTLFGGYKSYWRRASDGTWKALVFARGPRTRGPVGPAAKFGVGPYKRWPVRDSLEVRGGLRNTETAFSDSSRTSLAIAFKSFAAPDVAKMSGALYVFGPEEIARDFLAPAPAGFTGIMWSAEYGTVAASGDLGFNAGRVYSRPDASGGPPKAGGMFVTVWRRQPNGEWKYLVD